MERLSSIRKFSNILFFQEPVQKLILGSAFVGIAVKEAGKVLQQNVALIINHPKEGEDKSISHLLIFIAVSLIYITSVPAIEMLSTLLQCNIISKSFIHFYKDFLRYRFSDWKTFLKGDLYSSIIRRAKGLSTFFKTLIFDSCDNFAYMMIGVGTILLKYGFRSYFIQVLFLLVSFPIIINVLTVLRTRALREQNKNYDISENKLKDILQNFEMMHTYNTVDQEIESYSAELQGYIFWFKVYWILNNIIELVRKSIKSLMVGIIFSMVSQDIYKGNVTSTETKIVSDIMGTFISIFKRLLTFTDSLKTMAESTENFLTSNLDLLLVDEKSDGIGKKSFDSDIKVEEMKKYYGDNLVFKDVNLQFFKGEKVAITGPNGSGKSSFVRSVLGIERYQGRVLVDGIEALKIKDEDFRRIMAYVPQKNVLFEASILENLSSFDSTIPQEEIVKRVTHFGMHEEIKALGYNKMMIEKGSNISSAQRQKICFLRAVIKDTPVVIFDEMTSDMDKDYEEEIIKKVLETLKEKTVIMVIHNLNMLEKFDKVVFFDNKTSTGSLPLEDLLQQNPDFNQYYSRGLSHRR